MRDIIIFEDIIHVEMNNPANALTDTIFKSVVAAYITKDMSILDRLTDVVKRAYEDSELEEEKLTRKRIFGFLSDYCMTIEFMNFVVKNSFDYELSNLQLTEFRKRLIPMYWHLSESFQKHRKMNFRGLYQKYFIENKIKHIKKRKRKDF